MDRLIAIGDIHGYYGRLMALLDKIKPGANDRLVYLGDYIDRGRQSNKVIEFLMKQRDSRPQDIVLMGNHEAMLLRAYKQWATSPDMMDLEIDLDFFAPTDFFVNGGHHTMASYLGFDYRVNLEKDAWLWEGMKHMDAIPKDVIEFLKSLPVSYQHDNYFFVHAGIKPGVPLADQDCRDLLTINYDFTDSEADHGAVIVHGHTPGPVDIQHNRISVDAGVAYPNLYHCEGLAAVDVLNKEIYRVPHDHMEN